MTTVTGPEGVGLAQGPTWDEVIENPTKLGLQSQPGFGKKSLDHMKDASSLIRWFNEGAGGAIAWGTPGDWAQCVAVASAHMGVEDARGFCQLRHIEATGMSTAEHAHNEAKYSPDQPRDDHGRFGEGGGAESHISITEYAPTSLQVFARDDAGEEVGRLTLIENHGKWDVVFVQTSPELRRTGLATEMLLQFHDAHPDGIVRHGNWETSEGRAWSEQVVKRYPEWNVIEYQEGDRGPLPSATDFYGEDYLKYSPDQPRDDHGRFGTIGDVSVLGDVAVREGGFSISLAGDHPHHWVVSQSGTERSFSLEELDAERHGELTGVPIEPWHQNIKDEVNRFIADNRPDLRQPHTFLGGWVDSDRLFLDVSHDIESEEDAVKYAEENDQAAMYNAETGEYRDFRKSMPPAREREKVFLSVTEDSDPDEIAERLIAALFPQS